MALAATQIFDSPTAIVGYHYTVTGLTAGLNTINLVSLIGTQWPTTFIPSRVQVIPIFDGVHTVASKLMYDPATLSNTAINIYCDATGSTSCEIWVF
jgi:hypothetical protein